MKYYINPVSIEVFGYESDGSQDYLISPELKLLDDAELAEVRAEQEAANAPTPEQVLSAANAQRDSLLSLAMLRIAPLQYAVTLGSATDEDTANLKLWMQYSVAVNKVSAQPGFPVTIEWPVVPGGV